MKCIVSIYGMKSFKTIQFSFEIHCRETEHTCQLTYQEGNNNLDELSLSLTIKKEDHGPVWDKLVTDLQSLIVLVSNLNLLINFSSFWRIRLSKTFDELTVWVGNSCSVAVYILPSPRL